MTKKTFYLSILLLIVSVPAWAQLTSEPKIFPEATLGAELITALKNPSYQEFPSGTKAFSLALELPIGKKGDTISYKLFGPNNNLIIQDEIATVESFGKTELWAIRYKSTMIGLKSGIIFQNMGTAMKFSPTPLSSSITGGGIFVIYPVTTKSPFVSSSNYHLEIYLNNKITKTINFSIR